MERINEINDIDYGKLRDGNWPDMNEEEREVYDEILKRVCNSGKTSVSLGWDCTVLNDCDHTKFGPGGLYKGKIIGINYQHKIVTVS